MNLLCDYENYLRDRYILRQPVRYMYGGFGDASSGASASQSKQKVYGPDGNEYTYIDDPTSPNTGRYYRNVGGPGGGRIVFLDEIQETEQKRQMEDANKAAQPRVADNRQSVQRPAQEKPARRPVKKTWNLTEIEDANGDFLDVQVKASSEDEAKRIVADALKIQRDTRKKAGGGYSWELQEILEWGERNPEKFKQAVEDAKPQVERPQTTQKTESSAPQNEQVDADSAQHGSKKEDDEAGATEFKPGDLLFKRNLLDHKTGYGSYRSQPSEYGKASLDALFHALNANDLSYFEDTNPADFDNSKKFMVTTRLGDKKEFTARSLFEEIQEESADADGGFNIYNNADTNNFIDRYKGSKGWPRRFQKIFSETNKEPMLNWQLQLVANTLEDTNYEFAHGEFGGDYAPQYLDSVCSLVADLGQSLPPIKADPKIKAGFLNRYLCFLYGSALAAYASDEEGLHRKEADKLAWQFLKAGRGGVTSRLLKKLFNAAEKQGFTSPAIDSPIGIYSGVYYRDDFQKKENAPAAQKPEPKDVVARDVESASGPGVDTNADPFIEGVGTDGFGLPSSESTSPVIKDSSSNKDAAYFIRRDLEVTPKPEVEEGAEEVDDVSEASPAVQKPESKDVITREVSQTEKPTGNKKRGRTEEAFPELPQLNGDLQDIAVANEIRRRIHNWAIYTNYFDNKYIPGGYYIDGNRRLYEDEVYRRLFDKKTDARFWVDNEKDILNVLKKELDSGLAKLVNEGWKPSPEQAELTDLRYIEGEKFRDTARDNPNKYRSRSSAQFDTASNIRKYADKSLSVRNHDEAIQITKKLSSLAYYSATQGDEESTKICKDAVDRLFAKFGKDDYGQLAERQRVTDNHYQRAVNNAAKKRAKEEREAKRRAKEEQKTSGDAPKKKRGKKASNVPTAQEVIESETATLERAPLESAGLGLPGSQDSVLDANEGDNRDAAYFVQRDLGEESPSDQKAQEASVATPEPTRQEQPAKPRPERWTPLKSKMNDDDRRVVEKTRKRLNFGLGEFAWRLANAKEKKDWQKAKELTVLAAQKYLDLARRAYRSHGGADALAAFDESLSGEGLTVGQVRDRVVDKFRQLALMNVADLHKYAGERLDEWETFSQGAELPATKDKIALNRLLDKPHYAPNAVPYTPPEKGKIYEVPVDSLNLDPSRFQFKLNTNAQGVTDDLEGAEFDPMQAGIIHVWRDPDDGKDYVVNGHHRFNLAKNSGYDGKVNVRYIDADTADDAKAFGAVANIADSKGTATDVAEFIRTRGSDDIRTPAGKKIATKNRLLADGRVLSKLDDTIFRKLKNGSIDEKTARIIAAELPDDKEKQLQLFSDIERLGLDASQAQDRAWAYASIQGEKQQGSLFGDDAPMEYDVESRSKLIGEIRKALGGAKRAAQTGGSSRNNEYWESQKLATNFDRDRAKQLSKSAGQALDFFKDHIRLTGPMQNIIKEETDEYRKAIKSGKGAEKVVERAIERIKDVAQGGDGSVRRVEGFGLEYEDRLPSAKSGQTRQGVEAKGGREKQKPSRTPIESLRSGTAGEVLETGGADRLSDGGDGRDPASVIADAVSDNADLTPEVVQQKLDETPSAQPSKTKTKTGKRKNGEAPLGERSAQRVIAEEVSKSTAPRTRFPKVIDEKIAPLPPEPEDGSEEPEFLKELRKLAAFEQDKKNYRPPKFNPDIEPEAYAPEVGFAYRGSVTPRYHRDKEIADAIERWKREQRKGKLGKSGKQRKSDKESEVINYREIFYPGEKPNDPGRPAIQGVASDGDISKQSEDFDRERASKEQKKSDVRAGNDKVSPKK